MSTSTGTGLPAAAIGRYRLVRRIGAGSAGEVFLAIDGSIGRPAALKLQRAGGDVDEPEARRHFEQEARLLGALRHPDIAEVFEAGHWRGRPWMAMEWLPGHDLTRYTDPARLLPGPLVLEIVQRVARALAHAHRQGIVHRDVKPGNIRIHLPARMVKVADFGVARGDDSARTRTGVIVGSPVYMAPEQLAGAEAAPAADLYALGVVLFELLTGGVPYASGSFGELLRQVAAEPAPDLRTRRPELPQDLAQIVARVLAKRPDARFADGDTLAAALQAVTLHGL